MSEPETLVVQKRRIRYRVPFGFDIDPNDPTVAVPNPVTYSHLIEARKMRQNGATLQECGTYLHANTGYRTQLMNYKRILEREF